MTLFLQQLINGVALGSTYALFALGFGLVFASLGVLNIAHGTFATWGAILALSVVLTFDIPFAVALVAGFLGAGVIGIIVDQAAFQPLRNRGGGVLGPIITSIGFWIILGELAQIATGASARSYPADAVDPQMVAVGGLLLSRPQIFSMVAAAAVGGALLYFLTKTRFGSAIRAVGFSESAAMLGGVNPRMVIYVTAFIAAAVAGLAGILSGLSTNNVSHAMGEGLLLKGFAAVIVGGFGDVRGALVGGVIIGVSEVLGAQYISSSFRDAITFGLLFLFLILRPQGIFGEVHYERA